MAPATLVPTTDPPLDESHHRALAAATERAEPIRRAVRVATFNAWTTAILATLSAPFALFSLAGFLVFAALAVVAWNEFRGRRHLLKYDPAGATILGWNQLGLLAVITVYCVWALYSNLWGSGSIEAQLRDNPQLGPTINSIDGFDDLYRTIVVVLYGSVIALSALFQGANALYYFSRRKYVEAYVRDTPAWVIDLGRATRS
jgi:hypothetical protein